MFGPDDRRMLLDGAWDTSELTVNAYRAALEFEVESETYDRRVCSGPTHLDGIMPATDRERFFSSTHARKLRDVLLFRYQLQHERGRQAFRDAVHKVQNMGFERAVEQLHLIRGEEIKKGA